METGGVSLRRSVLTIRVGSRWQLVLPTGGLLKSWSGDGGVAALSEAPPLALRRPTRRAAIVTNVNIDASLRALRAPL